jgi:hypothetical protein
MIPENEIDESKKKIQEVMPLKIPIRKFKNLAKNYLTKFPKIAKKRQRKSRKILKNIQPTFEILLNPKSPWQSRSESTKSQLKYVEEYS